MSCLSKEQLGDIFTSDGTVVSGTGLRPAKTCGELSVLKKQISERDKMLAMYQDQCSMMEQEVTRYILPVLLNLVHVSYLKS